MCGSERVAPILYGLPANEPDEMVHLGGCIISEDNPSWHCKACGHEW
jgi:hypothetical protein